MKKKDHLPYTNIVGKKKKKESNGIDSVQPQKNVPCLFISTVDVCKVVVIAVIS